MGADFLHWLGTIITTLFPWPATVLTIVFLSPIRGALNNFATSMADLPRAVTAIKMAGVKINLDPSKAKEVLAISSEVVTTEFERVVDREVERIKLWAHFEQVISKGLQPLIDPQLAGVINGASPYRVTLHMPDTLQPEMLYQLTEYWPLGPFPKSKGRRKSIRFGAIGKAWRLRSSNYSPIVSTDSTDLIEDWGMTAEEADMAGRGRKTFLSVVITDASKIPMAIFYMDAVPANFLGQLAIKDIEEAILRECDASKLTADLVKVRTKMQDAARPDPS